MTSAPTPPEEIDVDAASPEPPVPTVDQLEDRLGQIDAVLNLLREGELDAAEAAIDALEQRIAAAPN